ncbi:MAG TPA: YbaN family protein [Ramlibacter sp.]|uniref:YbaN family protein n=1 Tax=Ramlibacter sp. TaxID=1917967 RepID=UPI002D800B8A|nr:YbaN family protein [Ramlibacter sp.]HET8748336.1 YbaN family protein [Ramlibacter sp.]
MENEAQTAPRGLTAPARWALQALAAVCVVLGVIGIIVPVLPTVPFLLVAAWAASRSSPRLHRWLLTHPRFGRPLRDWEEAKVVPRPAKWLATTMIAVSGPVMVYVAPAAWRPLAFVGLAAIVAVLVWLWRRPEHRPGA